MRQPRAVVRAVILVHAGVAGLSRVRQWADFGEPFALKETT